MKKSTKPKPAAKPAKPTNPNLDGNGREVRVGSVICDDGPTFGRVITVAEGGIIYRAYDYQGVSPDHQTAVAMCRDVTVVDGGQHLAVRLPGDADRWVRLALDVARVLDALELAESSGELRGVLGELNMKETLEGMQTAFWNLWSTAAGREVRMLEEPKGEVRDEA